MAKLTPENVFQYDHLPDPKHCIRLLKLSRGVPSRPEVSQNIVCELVNVPFSEQRAYKALSYTWGDSNHRYTIQLNSKEFQFIENLYSFLCAKSSSLINCLNLTPLPEFAVTFTELAQCNKIALPFQSPQNLHLVGLHLPTRIQANFFMLILPYIIAEISIFGDRAKNRDEQQKFQFSPFICGIFVFR
ncbi:hypothetical protein G7Y89_g1822 [Cudoniella acicularis]|uniref:Heterokaryon incompatibility domain-containing protein n=1 Tax=Cudoniella acicularis TaxID=354080 RepID=A0A8H4RWG5_9HELO|nr:hypothetical protein G7Y89_g1822 [Cudoniella acicularis]